MVRACSHWALAMLLELAMQKFSIEFNVFFALLTLTPLLRAQCEHNLRTAFGKVKPSFIGWSGCNHSASYLYRGSSAGLQQNPSLCTCVSIWGVQLMYSNVHTLQDGNHNNLFSTKVPRTKTLPNHFVSLWVVSSDILLFVTKQIKSCEQTEWHTRRGWEWGYCLYTDNLSGCCLNIDTFTCLCPHTVRDRPTISFVQRYDHFEILNIFESSLSFHYPHSRCRETFLYRH